jgi:hypothetical protein
MKKNLTFLIPVLLLTSVCSERDPIEHENFVGQWTVSEVIYDGTIKPEWTGRSLVFEQTDLGGGRYSMIDTMYDSIWSAGGTWTKSTDQFELVLDDNWPVWFTCANDELTIIKLIPWTQRSTCDENGICVLIVTGQWEFRFKRK